MRSQSDDCKRIRQGLEGAIFSNTIQFLPSPALILQGPPENVSRLAPSKNASTGPPTSFKYMRITFNSTDTFSIMGRPVWTNFHYLKHFNSIGCSAQDPGQYVNFCQALVLAKWANSISWVLACHLWTWSEQTAHPIQTTQLNCPGNTLTCVVLYAWLL